jgi:hypothetical protein
VNGCESLGKSRDMMGLYIPDRSDDTFACVRALFERRVRATNEGALLSPPSAEYSLYSAHSAHCGVLSAFLR